MRGARSIITPSHRLLPDQCDADAMTRYHLENPYWQTFDKYVIPLLDREMDLRRLNELDTSKPVRVENDEGLWERVKKHQTY